MWVWGHIQRLDGTIIREWLVPSRVARITHCNNFSPESTLIYGVILRVLWMSDSPTIQRGFWNNATNVCVWSG